jgi:hypothetical protein
MDKKESKHKIWKRMKVESVSWNKNLFKNKQKENKCWKVWEQKKKTNWNSCIGSVKENDEFKRKEIK